MIASNAFPLQLKNMLFHFNRLMLHTITISIFWDKNILSYYSLTRQVWAVSVKINRLLEQTAPAGPFSRTVQSKQELSNQTNLFERLELVSLDITSFSILPPLVITFLHCLSKHSKTQNIFENICQSFKFKVARPMPIKFRRRYNVVSATEMNVTVSKLYEVSSNIA